MKREIQKYLREWKAMSRRKVLLVRGARQVGKTYIIRELGKEFTYFVEVNFEAEPELRSIFKGNSDPHEISKKLSVYYDTPVKDGETLLFFDEIQACPDALQALRYFYEKRPGLHVVAAGSLLEFALQNLASYGVGRITSLFIYPMSFNEFLVASGKEQIMELKQNASHKKPLDKVFHRQLNELFIRFLILGGMPEVVKMYLETDDLLQAQTILDDINLTLEDDFAKYKKRLNTSRLKEVYESIIYQSGNKFVISKSAETGNFEQKKEALELLEMAGLCYKVYHTSANGVPLAAERNYKKFKTLFIDTGLFQRRMKVKLADYMFAHKLDHINKGNIAEHFVGVELVKQLFLKSKPDLFYWKREKRGSNAEVDFLLECNRQIIPVEIKSGTQGKMQSLHKFMHEKNVDTGIRISMENFSSYGGIKVYPLYAVDTMLNLHLY